jgi:hypothetical protein
VEGAGGNTAACKVAIAALVLAGWAVRVSGVLAKKSSSRPFVLEKIYDLYVDRRNRHLDAHGSLAADFDRLVTELQMIRAAAPILEAAGLGKMVAAIEKNATEFGTIRSDIIGAGSHPDVQESKRLTDAAAGLDRAVQDLPGALEPKVKRALKDPFEEFQG